MPSQADDFAAGDKLGADLFGHVDRIAKPSPRFIPLMSVFMPITFTVDVAEWSAAVA